MAKNEHSKIPKISELEEELAFQIRCSPILPEPEREFWFWTGRKHRFDFAWKPQMLAVECEGGTWSGGRHTRGKGFEDDCVKYNEAALLGWTVLRFPAAMIKDGRALATIERARDW